MWASVISGIKRVASAERKEKGKNSTGIAMPLSAPYCETACSRLPRKGSRQAGTSILSAVCRALAVQRLPSTGSRMAQSRPIAFWGRRGFWPGKAARRSRP